MGMAVAAPDLEPVPPFSPSRRYRGWLRANILPYALIGPSVLVIAGILAFPLGMLVWLSLQHYGLHELIHHAGDWVDRKSVVEGKGVEAGSWGGSGAHGRVNS